MEQLLPILNETHFRTLLQTEDNKIILDKFSTYEKIDFILEIIEFMDRRDINYKIDKDLNIIIIDSTESKITA